MRRAPLLAGLAAAALLAPAAAAQAPSAITFCASENNLPLSHPEVGIEVDFARALAARLGVEAHFAWVPLEERPDEALLQGRCDAALGAVTDPGPMARGHAPPGVALSEPYYGAGYLLIHRTGAPPVRSLAELGDTRVAVEVESVPIYTLKQRGHRVHAMDDYDAVLRAVAQGRVDYGYLWGPLAAWLVRDRSDVALAEEFEPVERWSFSLAVREDDGALLRSLNGAITELVREGKVAHIFSRYRLPYLPPR